MASNGKYEIEDGVPLPPSTRRKYPFGEMLPGQSVVIPATEALRARNAAHERGRRSSMRFATKTMDDGSIRIWRVE